MKKPASATNKIWLQTSLCLILLSSASCVSSKHYRIDPETIAVMPVEAAISFLEPVLDNAISYKTRERMHCRLDPSGISCDGTIPIERVAAAGGRHGLQQRQWCLLVYERLSPSNWSALWPDWKGSEYCPSRPGRPSGQLAGVSAQVTGRKIGAAVLMTCQPGCWSSTTRPDGKRCRCACHSTGIPGAALSFA
jgi:hypothetical protein